MYIYKPTNLPADAGIFVYLHGGGFALGTRDGYDTCCNVISQWVRDVIDQES